MEKRIYRSRKESMIAGVCGGLGEYFDLDPIIFRIIFVLLIFAGGAGIIAYIIAWIIIPEVPETQALGKEAKVSPTPGATAEESKPEKAKLLGGLILITVGTIFLLSNLFDWFSLGRFWPAALIVIGIIIILKAKDRKNENPASA